MSPEVLSTRDRVFSQFGSIFTNTLHQPPPPLPPPLTTQRITILKKWKSTRDIIILHKWTINDNHMMYGSWDINCNRQIFFVILGQFLSFYPPNSANNEKFIKNEKVSGDIIILHKCIKTYGHRLYYSWDMMLDGCNYCILFWTIFCPFTPLTVQKIKTSKKMEKVLEISSFYTCIP